MLELLKCRQNHYFSHSILISWRLNALLWGLSFPTRPLPSPWSPYNLILKLAPAESHHPLWDWLHSRLQSIPGNQYLQLGLECLVYYSLNNWLRFIPHKEMYLSFLDLSSTHTKQPKHSQMSCPQSRRPGGSGDIPTKGESLPENFVSLATSIREEVASV